MKLGDKVVILVDDSLITEKEANLKGCLAIVREVSQDGAVVVVSILPNQTLGHFRFYRNEVQIVSNHHDQITLH